MPAPILAAPLVIPFAEAIGVSIAALGMAKATDKVNEFIQENPEQSIKIFQMIMPSQGIANILKNESSEGDEDIDEEVEVEKDPRSKKEIVLEGVRRAREGKGNYSSPDATGSAVSGRGNVIRGLEDAGKIRKGPNPNYDASKKYQGYKRFIRPKKADGGAIGIEVLLEEENPRQGLFMGGSPLTGQALSIYNSMNAYGFDDQAIADALMEQGLYTPSGAPVVEEGIISAASNIINQGGGDGPPNDPPKDPYGGLGYSSANFGLGNTAINKDAVMDYEADAYEIGRTPFGQLSKFGVTALNALKNIPTPINLARMAYESYKQKQIEKKAQEEAIARDIARDMQESNRASRTGGYQAGYDSDFMDGPSGGGSTGGSPGSSGPGGSDSMGSFARGGLAAMFKKKR